MVGGGGHRRRARGQITPKSRDTLRDTLRDTCGTLWDTCSGLSPLRGRNRRSCGRSSAPHFFSASSRATISYARVHGTPAVEGQHLGALAQLGEHLLCKQGVIGSIPIRSTEEGRVEIDASCALNSRKSLLTKNGGRGATMALLPLSFSTPLEYYRSCTLRCTQRAIRSRSA